MKRVLVIQEHLPAFRVGFYQILRRKLGECDVELDLIYAPNQRNTFVKGELDWAIPVPIRWGKGGIGWQPVLGHCRNRDLVVVQQETKYLANPVLQLWRKVGGPKVAYWGHGRNFQARDPDSRDERLKAWLARHVDWWFAYNRLSAEAVRATGFPSDRITEVMNAIDTWGLREIRARTGEGELDALRRSLGIAPEDRVAAYTGGLYERKRLGFLLETADLVRRRIPDFHLIVIGGGPDAGVVEAAAEERPWLHAVGPKSDEEKVPYWMLSSLVLIPGLVGLVVVDAMALGVPLVTTDYPYHSPEIDYLESGRNGLLVECGEDVGPYTEAVADLLGDEARWARLASAAEADGSRYSLETMAENFAGGVVECLGNG